MKKSHCLSFTVDGINLEFENQEIKKKINVDEVVLTIKKNSPALVDFLKEQNWTFAFVMFHPDGDDIVNAFFTVDIAEKKIYFSMISFIDDNMLYHYISYAIIHACDYELLKESFADRYEFEAMMMAYFSKFCVIVQENVLKMVNVYKKFDLYEENLSIDFTYEYSSKYKFLYEAYATMVDGNLKLKEKCPGLYECIYSTYF